MAHPWPEALAGVSEFVCEQQQKLGVELFDYQWDALLIAAGQPVDRMRLCLYHKTGAGKSITALLAVALAGHTAPLVVAPPSTHADWKKQGERLGLRVETISHAKFRMKDFRISRSQALIADEMHLFGGHQGKGWKKLDRLAAGLQAPLVLASATPNYNDADRVYCIQHVLDPWSCRGGFLEFLYTHCLTEQNPFSMMPDVTGFKHHADAAAYLADLPHVAYLPDDAVYSIANVPFKADVPEELERLGYNRRRHKMVGSLMEARHTRTIQSLVTEDGRIQPHVYDLLGDMTGSATTPTMVYADHSTVADALSRSLADNGVDHVCITGGTTTKQKDELVAEFKTGEVPVLVGTASIATGTDGLDRVCDYMVILDDTTDDSLRRQLIGRILPRGGQAGNSKSIFRLVAQW